MTVGWATMVVAWVLGLLHDQEVVGSIPATSDYFQFLQSYVFVKGPQNRKGTKVAKPFGRKSGRKFKLEKCEQLLLTAAMGSNPGIRMSMNRLIKP